MSGESIDVVGITRLHEYPKCIDKYNCKQIIENDNLCLPCQKPDIESVLQIYVDVKVKCFKVIKTILGRKVLIEGIKKIKIMYVADEPTQSVHSAHWDIHFCEFVLIKENHKCKDKKYVKDVFIGVESTMITNISCRCIDICNLLILCPLVEYKKCHEEEEIKKCDCNDRCEEVCENVGKNKEHPKCEDCRNNKCARDKKNELIYAKKGYYSDMNNWNNDNRNKNW